MKNLLNLFSATLLWSTLTIASANPMSRGEYLAHAGDCMACHTQNPDQPYGGGHGLASPIGTIYATNISPDTTYGIGHYTYEDFAKAMRDGVRPNGEALYPAMPFVSYAKINDEDMHALYDYFMHEVAPVAVPNRTNEIEWPLNLRFPMTIWNQLFTSPELYQYDETKSAEYNRGAYLVQGLGHCGTCHTPRSIALVEEGLTEASPKFLAGGQVGHWYAPSLRHLGEIDENELLKLLKDGRNEQHAFAGPMSEVTSFSLRHLADDDLMSMIIYLKEIQLPMPTRFRGADHVKPSDEGMRLYQDLCSTCHGDQGQGEKNVVPALRDRGYGTKGDAMNVALVMIEGAQTAHRADRLPYEMPAYANRLTDEEITQITNVIVDNEAWNNDGVPLAERDIKTLKAEPFVASGWWVMAGGIIAVCVLILLLLRWRRTS